MQVSSDITQDDFEGSGLVTLSVNASAQPLAAGAAELTASPPGSVQLDQTRDMEVTVNLDATSVSSAGKP